MADVTGTAALDFGGISVAATGRVVKPGTAALSLGGMTVAATGRGLKTGHAAMNLGGMALAAVVGPEDVTGTITMFLGI